MTGRALHLVDTTMFWSPSSGGVRRYVQTKHAWLARQPNLRHTIAVPRLDGAAPSPADLPAVPLPFSGGYRLPIDRAGVARVLAGLEPDLIEAGDPYRTAWGALDAARALHIPAVACCHSNLEAMARLAGGRTFGRAAAALARRYARHLYARFDLVLAPSRHMAEAVADWGVGRVECQPLGVDGALFHPSRADRAGWRSELGLPSDARVLVYAGRFAPEKNLGVLADAVQALGANYVLVAIGAGPAPPPAGERVVVRPFMSASDALARALASADVFVHAGDQETFGLSALEAMACGTPVVVRRAAGLAELVDERAAVGIGVDKGTGPAFAEAVHALFERDAAAWSALRAAARERAVAADWQQVLPGLLGRYLRLLGRSETGAFASEAALAPVPQ